MRYSNVSWPSRLTMWSCRRVDGAAMALRFEHVFAVHRHPEWRYIAYDVLMLGKTWKNIICHIIIMLYSNKSSPCWWVKPWKYGFMTLLYCFTNIRGWEMSRRQIRGFPSLRRGWHIRVCQHQPRKQMLRSPHSGSFLDTLLNEIEEVGLRKTCGLKGETQGSLRCSWKPAWQSITWIMEGPFKGHSQLGQEIRKRNDGSYPANSWKMWNPMEFHSFGSFRFVRTSYEYP